MSKTPGPGLGSSSFSAPPLLAYSRPGVALTAAAVGFIVACAVTLLYSPVLRPTLSGMFGEFVAVLPIIDLVVLSLPLISAVIFAAVRASRGGAWAAVGLRRITLMDVMLGLSAGLAVRALIELIAPTTGSLTGPLDAGASGATLLATGMVVFGLVMVSPFVEELFFRGLVLRATRDVLGRWASAGVAAVVSLIVSTALFVLLHAVPYGIAVPPSLVLASALVGLVCGTLTLVTGRLGAAVVAHATSNALAVVLLLT